MTQITVFGEKGWSWVLEQELFFFKVVKVKNSRVLAEVTSFKILKRTDELIKSYDKKSEI